MPKVLSRDKNEEQIKGQLIDSLINELPVLRARLSISQAVLANKIGISRQTYNSFETKSRKMNWTTFMALLAVFQNNIGTKQMMDHIDGFNDKIGQVTKL